MRIEAVHTIRITVPLHRPFVTAVRRTDHAESILVQVRDTDGRCGWGKAAHNPRVTGETSAGVAAAIDAAARPAAACDYIPDLDPPYLLRHSPVVGGISTDGPSIVLTDAPGSGIGQLADVPAGRYGPHGKEATTA